MTDTLGQQNIDTFLNELASSAPTPGGGSVAALTGAMAAGLVSMVCALTMGKKANADFEEEARSIQAQSEELRHEFQSLAQDDIEIFKRLSAAYKLPKTTAADAASRKAAIQTVTRHATEIPLRVARAATMLLPFCTTLANRCGRLLVSDIGIATILVRSTVQSALLNVEINLTSLEDQIYVREVQAQMEDLSIGLSDQTRGILEIVRTRINQ